MVLIDTMTATLVTNSGRSIFAMTLYLPPPRVQ